MKTILLALLFSLPAFATEVVLWENIPLPVTLHVGQERIVDVGKPVRIGYPATLEGKVRLQSAGGKVFLLANTAFPATRIQLRDIGSGELILLDIQAIQSTLALEPVQISYAPQTPATAKTPVPPDSRERKVIDDIPARSATSFAVSLRRSRASLSRSPNSASN